jgi:hypothetical protein
MSACLVVFVKVVKWVIVLVQHVKQVLLLLQILLLLPAEGLVGQVALEMFPSPCHLRSLLVRVPSLW